MLYPNWNSWSGRSVPTVLVGSPYPSGFSPPFETRRPLHQFYYSVVPEDLTSLAQVTSRLSGSPELGCSKEKGRLSCVSKYVSQIHSEVDVSRSDVSTPCMSSVGTCHRSGKTRLFTLLMQLLRGLSPNQTLYPPNFTPLEVLDHIVSHPHDVPTLLKMCSLVSKSWVWRTRRHVFADV
jgi:hypothetical protein